jgi:anti-sigma-K factor RskA
MDRQTFLDLIPAYALGALDADERTVFEAQLAADDTEAQELLAQYLAMADTLVLTVPARPAPAHLGDDLRQRLAAQKSTQPAAHTVQRWPLRWLAAAAAILAIAIGLGWAVTQFMPSDTETPAGALYEDLTTRGNIVRVAVSPSDDFQAITGELVADPETNTAVIQVRNLPELESDQTFQLWIRNTSTEELINGGLFRGSAEDDATYFVLPLDQPFANYQSFGFSLEPAEGSPFPDRRSGPGVFVVRLSET